MEEIVKVAENNVEVKSYRVAKPEEKIYEAVEVYGESRMKAELLAVEKQILELTNLDVVKQKEETLSKLNAQRLRLLEIKKQLEAKES